MESTLSTRDLRDLFSLRVDTLSDTHDKYNCKRCSKDKLKTTLAAIYGGVGGTAEGAIDSDAAVQCSTVAGAPAAARQRTSKFKAPRRSAHSRASSKAAASGGSTHPKFPSVPRFDAPQVGCPGEGDLNDWSHHIGEGSANDGVLRKAGKGLVSFVFAQVIDGDLLRENAGAMASARAARVARDKAVLEADAVR